MLLAAMPARAAQLLDGANSMFRGLWAIIYKELLQVRRDPSTRFVLLIPLMQTIIFGFAIDMDVQHIATSVLDLSHSTESRRLVERFESTGTFRIVDYARSEPQLREQIVAGRARVGLIIPPDYSSHLLRRDHAQVQVLIDGSESSVANNAQQTARSLGLIESLTRGGLDPEHLAIDIRTRMLFNPDLESGHFYVPGVVGIVLQTVTVMLTAFAIVRERERGTLEQLVVTPVGRGALMVGKIVPYALIGFVQTALVLAVMVWIFHVPIAGSLTLLLILSGLFLLSALSMGILISTMAHNQADAMQRSLLIMLPSILLSGFAFPRETMPVFIHGLGYLIPVTYYIQILRGIILRGAGMAQLWPQTLALAAFAIVLVALSTLRFQKRMS
jgi:ABC-2 type transport system permease protein